MGRFHGLPILLGICLTRVVFCSPTMKATNVNQLRTAAAEAMKNLMSYYEPNSEGVFNTNETPWHESGMIWEMHFDYAKWTGDHQFLGLVTSALVNVSHTSGHSFLAGKGASYEETIKGHWNDDILWQSLAAVGAADIYGPHATLPGAGADADWITLAVKTYDQAGSQVDNKCGGGIYWYRDRDDSKGDYKSLITQLEFIAQGARNYLHTRDASALQQSEQILGWVFSSGLGDPQTGVLMDGVSVKDCGRYTDYQWSYNYGQLLGALAWMHRATGQQKYMDLAVPFLHHSLRTFAGPGTLGVIAELCEARNSCHRNQKGFKSIFVRNLAYLYRETNDAAVKEAIQNVIDTSVYAMMERSCDDDWNCSGYWARGVPAKRYIRSQHVSTALLVAALGIHTHSPENPSTEPSFQSWSRGPAQELYQMKAVHKFSTAKSYGPVHTFSTVKAYGPKSTFSTAKSYGHLHAKQATGKTVASANLQGCDDAI